MQRLVRYAWNILSGGYVLLLSMWMSGPGIGETDTPTYRWYFMLWFIMWGIGFILQFKGRTRRLGIIITFIPTVFYLYLYLVASMG